MKKEIITVKTITLALKAKKMLVRENIKSRIIKVDSSKTEHGCSYGIEFNSADFFTVISILKENEFMYSVYRGNR